MNNLLDFLDDLEPIELFLMTIGVGCFTICIGVLL